MLNRKPLVSTVAALLALLCLFAVSTTVEGQTATTGSISGNAYTFNTRNVIAGATIRSVEFPDVSTTTAADGSYTLEFPAGSSVTLYIEAAGHESIRIQTFTLDEEHEGTNVVGANFQTPTTAVYDGLRALITHYTGRDPFEGGCVIVTTVGMAELRGMPFEEFIRFAPHGVAGATATISPAAASPIYFNESVVPDNTEVTTSNDGGVLWPNVPPGRYVLSAQHPSVHFTTATVDCQVGEVVNANPVWGLHAVEPPDTSTTTDPASTTTTDHAGGTTTAPSVSTSTTVGTTSTAAEPGSTSTSPVAGPGPTDPTTSTAAAGAGVGGSGEERPRGGALSRTGAESVQTVALAVALIFGGGLLLALSRRRHATPL